MLTTEDFRGEIENFLRAKEMSASAFGLAAVNDPNFVHDLRAGRSPTLETASKVAAFMKANAPSEAA